MIDSEPSSGDDPFRYPVQIPSPLQRTTVTGRSVRCITLCAVLSGSDHPRGDLRLVNGGQQYTQPPGQGNNRDFQKAFIYRLSSRSQGDARRA
jgi:hypothetical protein